MEKKGNLYVVGIGGVSNGGKTTLCKSLSQHLKNQGVKVRVIHQDDYFKEEENVPWHESGNFRKWDDMVAVDMEKMIDAVHCQITQLRNSDGVSVLIIEGFLIYSHKYLNSMYSKRVFLTLTKEVALMRRLNRVYDPPDTDTIFEDHVWPMYLLYYDQLKKDKVEIMEFDGTSSPESTLENVINEIYSSIKAV